MRLKKVISLIVTTLILSSIVLVAVSLNSKGFENLRGVKAKVYKTPYCSCCDLHIGYLKGYGIQIEVVEMEDISGVKKDLGIPDELLSCHTTLIGGYFVEGHVPVEAISKLIKEEPDVRGISLPGMPSGSPGMPGTKEEPFVIYAVNDEYYEYMVI
jgi:hypothetical protein